MQFHQLRYFVAAANLLNLTRAAEREHVSQPALNRQIRLLEEELGAALFKRDKNGSCSRRRARPSSPWRGRSCAILKPRLKHPGAIRRRRAHGSAGIYHAVSGRSGGPGRPRLPAKPCAHGSPASRPSAERTPQAFAKWPYRHRLARQHGRARRQAFRFLAPLGASSGYRASRVPPPRETPIPEALRASRQSLGLPLRLVFPGPQAFFSSRVRPRRLHTPQSSRVGYDPHVAVERLVQRGRSHSSGSCPQIPARRMRVCAALRSRGGKHPAARNRPQSHVDFRDSLPS